MKNTLLELLKAELVGDHPPVGWYTINELAEKLGVKRGVVQALIARKGWQCKKYRAQTRDGKVILANHYNVGKL
jgi:uncharacterized protein YjcR